MPTTDEDGSVQEADLDVEGALPAGPEEMRPGTPTERSWGGWSEQEWKRWNAYYAWSAPSGDPGVGSGDGAGATSSLGPTASAAPTAPQGIGHDPWWGNQGDPWQGHEDRRSGAGGQDKIQVPEYNGEDDRDGLKAKGYIRKIEAWRRVTRLTRPKRAPYVAYFTDEEKGEKEGQETLCVQQDIGWQSMDDLLPALPEG